MTRPTESPGRPAPTKKTTGTPTPPNPSNPWHALWAMMIGFFMILVDSTIVAVANPSIMGKLQTDYDAVIWVTSAYLLAYAVPLLLAGRLGDQFGPKNLYLTGLFVFTAASLWCGLSGSIETLIAARVLQGIGAALLTPQTLSTITRIFPADRRGAAMSVWGATAGVATLVGPLAGGVLVDHLGWQWIFFVNVPIGIIGLVLASRLVPVLPTNRHRFDVLGVILSGAAMFLVVFGLQEGESHHWSAWIWGTIGGGVVAMLAFVYWQAVNKSEPLIPLRIFRDRNFSLANIGVAVIGFAVVAMVVPVMFYAQVVCGLTPTRSALLTAPMAIATGMLAPIVGKIVDRSHPRPIIGFGFSVLAIALTWLSVEMTPTTPIWRLLLPFTAMGVGMAFIWAPLAATATRNLPGPMAGAGSGVYNATRQIGSVLGSAGIAAFMTSRISAEMPAGQGRPSSGGAMQLPEFLRVPFADALSQAVLLPAFVALFGVVAALFMIGGFGSTLPGNARIGDRRGKSDVDDDSTEVIPVVRDTSYDSPYRREFASQPDMFRRDAQDDWYVDDDDNEYIEFTVDRDPEYAPVHRRYAEFVTTDDYRADDDYAERAQYADATDYVAEDQIAEDYASTDGYAADDYGDDQDDDFGDTDDYMIRGNHASTGEIPSNDMAPNESDTAPIATRVEHPRAAPDEVWHSTPVESWHSLLADATPVDEVAEPTPMEPIGFAHNGFHVDDEKFQPLPRHTPAPERPAPPATPTPPVRPTMATPWLQPGNSNGDLYADSFQWLIENIDSMSDRYSDSLPERQHRYRDSAQNGASAAAYEKSSRDNGAWSAVYENSSRHSQSDEADVRRPRHYREDPDDLENYGRHSLPWQD